MQGLVDQMFVEPYHRLMTQLHQVLPSVATVVAILILGLAVGYLARVVLTRLLTWLKFDRLMDRAGFTSMILRTQIFRSASDFAGRLVQGFVWLFMILLALSAAGSRMTEDLVVRFFNYVPDLITAGLVLMLASVLSKFLARSALLAAVNAQWRGARLLAGSVRVLVMTLGVVIALEQLRIGRSVLLVTFAILFAGFVIAAAIAVGMGARDTVRNWMESQVKQSPPAEEETFHHL